MLKLDKTNFLALEATANALIISALTHGAPPKLVGPVIGEVRASHAVVIAGASQVAAAWGVLLRPLNLEVSSRSVLIHAAPKVRFKDVVTSNLEERELGDLLIVIDYVRRKLIVDRRAVLIQAKLADPSGLLPLDVSGKAQRNLYLHWPEFVMPNGYRPHKRDLNDKTCKGSAIDGCRFGGIDLHSSPRGWKQIRTAQSMSARQKISLGSSIAQMACGAAGRQAVKGANDPWSELVDELLSVTFGSMHPAKSGIQRSWETLSFSSPSIDRVIIHREGRSPLRGFPEDASTSTPSAGISTVHVRLEEMAEIG